MFLLLSSSGSPLTHGQTLHGGAPPATSTSTNSAQSAVTATPAPPAASSRRGTAATHKARHPRAAAHHIRATHAPAAPVTHTAHTTAPSTTPASHTTPHTTNTPTKPAPKHSTSTPSKPASPPATKPAADPCSSGAVGCGGGLIFGDGPTTLATAPAIGLGAYQGVATGATTLSQVVARFGAPLSTGAVRNFIGAGAYAGLVGAQPSGASCAYYLDSSLRTTRAFQLCFNSAHELTQKAVISTSGGGSSGSS
jgi:hypothetical protein